MFIHELEILSSERHQKYLIFTYLMKNSKNNEKH